VPDADRPSPAPARLPRAVWTLGLVSLFVDLSSEMLYPVVPLFLAGTLGAPFALIGLIEGAAELTAGLSKGYFGGLSDRWRRRRVFVTAGYALSALSKPLPGLWVAWPGVLVSRVADRVGKGVRTAPRDALLAAYATDDNRGRVFGLHRALDTLGAALGPAVALVWLAARPGDYRPLFFLAFVPAAVGAALTLRVREQAPTTAPAPGRGSVLAFWREATPEYRRLLGWLVVFALVNSSDVFLILKAREALGDTLALGGYILYNLVYAAASYPAGGLSDHWGRRRTLALGLACYALTYLGFAAAGAQLPGSLWTFGALFALYGVYAALTEGVAKAWLADVAPLDASRGRAMGLHAATTSLAALVASTGAGALWSGVGPAVPFAVGAAGALVVAAGLLATPERRTLRAR
jgi:MFS family permease